MNQHPDIVIVGAGAAGTGAARHLSGRGFSVLILEALPRPGGRGWTRQAAGVPLDLGCGWLHSGDRNPWTGIATGSGFTVDRRHPAWGAQANNLGFSPADQDAASGAFEAWNERLAAAPPASDCAADALETGSPWLPYLQALSGYISGDELERISARDYIAYDNAATDNNWRVVEGYGALIAASLPKDVDFCPDMPLEALTLDGHRVALKTPGGTVHARAAILTMSTNVLAKGPIAWPAALDPWREAAGRLPLGRNEKLFLEIVGDGPFAPESHLLGNPRDAATGSYYIRPLDRPVIECFLGGQGARIMEAEGQEAAFARAMDELAALFGATARRHLRPLIASDWARTVSIGGGYSHALPGHADARGLLARPFDGRLFFAGEATHATDFSTAHGAYETGVRAAREALAAL